MECIRRSIVHRRSIRTALFLLAGLAATLASRPGATLLPHREGWGKAFRASRRDQADHTLSGWLGQGLYNIAADDLSADVGNFDPQPSSYASYARTPTFHLDEALPPAPLPYPHPRFPSQSIVAVDAREYQLLMRLEVSYVKSSLFGPDLTLTLSAILDHSVVYFPFISNPNFQLEC
eukprot:1391696-Amorphochlora_amoeboformis.AAC.1